MLLSKKYQCKSFLPIDKALTYIKRFPYQKYQPYFSLNCCLDQFKALSFQQESAF